MLNIKEDILKLGVKQLMAPVDFYSIYFATMDVTGDQQLFSSSKFFKVSSVVFNIRKKRIDVWNDMRLSKWLHNFHFWVNYSFKEMLLFFICSFSWSVSAQVTFSHVFPSRAEKQKI